VGGWWAGDVQQQNKGMLTVRCSLVHHKEHGTVAESRDYA